MGEVFSDSGEQRCWNHKMLGVLPKTVRAKVKPHLTSMKYAAGITRAEGPWGNLSAESQGGANGRGKLAAPDSLLSLSSRALEALAHPQCCRVAVLAGALPHRGLAPIQILRRCALLNLVDIHGDRKKFSKVKCLALNPKSLGGRERHRWSQRVECMGLHLTIFTHCLTTARPRVFFRQT